MGRESPCRAELCGLASRRSGSDLGGPQDARSGKVPTRLHAMEEEEATRAPHGQPDLPAAPTAAGRGRHPTGHGEREAGGRA